MKQQKINIPIFGGSIIFYKVDNFDELNKKYNVSMSNKYGAYTFENEESDTFEYIVCFVDTNYSLLAHEAIHVCNSLFKNIGVKLDTDNDEVQAYVVGWIVDEMINFLES